MSLSEFDSTISAAARTAIETELKHIEDDFDVQIIFAVESGSRAWGFPSPDSDYDVRFVYVHPRDWYLSIRPGRDVIERPISDELDISGWDIKKALGLLMKPNPVMFEWLSSPIRYRWDQDLCDRLISFCEKPARSTACLYHYLNLGLRQVDLHLNADRKVLLKKYFYALRPALAIRWMRIKPGDLPPMNIQELVSGLDLDDQVIGEIENLIERKARINEDKTIERIPLLDTMMSGEFEWAENAKKEKNRRDLTPEANSLFVEILGRYSKD